MASKRARTISNIHGGMERAQIRMLPGEGGNIGTSQGGGRSGEERRGEHSLYRVNKKLKSNVSTING